MKTPITKTKGNPDKLMWKHSMSGNYKVNQAYCLIHQLQTLLNNGEQSITMASDSTWKFIWNVQLPVRILNFIWKIMHDSLPVFVILNRKGISTSTRRLLCDAEKESITHLFLQCTFARAVWHGSMLGIRTTEMN